MRTSEREANERTVFEVARKPAASGRDLLGAVTGALHDRFTHCSGVYIYILQGDTLVLAEYRGRPTEHIRIPVGEGICGRAASVKATVTIDDVNSDPDYIACSLETRSEIVVPILLGDRVLGEIDIDSDVPAAFSARDNLFLEELARELAPRLESSGGREAKSGEK